MSTRDAKAMISVHQRFAGKVALITGGTSGIGLALAKAFLREGAQVAICARSPACLDMFEAAYPATLAIPADVRDPVAQKHVLDQVVARFGRLDILVSNAGRLTERDFATGGVDLDDLTGEFALNLIAPVQLTAQALAVRPEIEALVFISSGYALVSPTRAPTYGAAKAGLHAFAEALRRQVEPRGMHVLEVIPPVVDTPATAHRNVRKVSAEEVAAATLDSLARRERVALIGATRFLPTLLRIAPKTIARMVAAT